MCGICGIIYFEEGRTVPSAPVKQMLDKIQHRGPDDEGVFINENIALGHRRLSIIDLSSLGRQPMSDKHQQVYITYNGEIYNYKELRKQLAPKYEFLSHSDTEVLIYAYLEWGKECLSRLNGMFAFAIYDTRSKEVFLVRDRFGIKPLYYYQDEEQLIFASDIPPIVSILNKKPEPDDQTVLDFLVYSRTNHSERTFFKGIKKLQHGHCLTIRSNAVKMERWYDLRKNLKAPFETPQALKESLIEAVRLQMRSDVPVGVCLSGGLDSSSITAILLDCLQRKDFFTYSAVFNKGERGDESEFIRTFENRIPKMKYTAPSVETLLHDLHEFVLALAEPVTSASEYSEYKVMQLAKNHSVVLLNGQGVDEQMAGYLYFAGFYYKELLNSLHLLKLAKEIFYDIKNHGSLVGPLSLPYFCLPSSFRERLAHHSSSYVSKGIVERTTDPAEILDKLYQSSGLQESFIDHFEYKLEHHLLWADKSGMWFSLETRFPFLDHNLVERTISLPSDKQIRNGWNKFYLREAMKSLLPERILYRRDKVGFDTPSDKWLRDERVQEIVHASLRSESLKKYDFINVPAAEKMYAEHVSGSRDYSNAIWKCVNLSLWLDKFICC